MADLVTTLVILVQWLLMLALFITSYIQSRDAWYDYVANKSSFHVSKEPIDVEDLPTITFCYEPIEPQQSVADNFTVHYYHDYFFSDTVPHWIYLKKTQQ